MTKHSAMYPKARAAAAGDPTATPLLEKKFITLDTPLGEGCLCAIREADEEEKENMINEVHATYESILQLEQALIELDEQNTTNTLEIRKREAKMVFIMKQMEELEEMLTF